MESWDGGLRTKFVGGGGHREQEVWFGVGAVGLPAGSMELWCTPGEVGQESHRRGEVTKVTGDEGWNMANWWWGSQVLSSKESGRKIQGCRP